ncbi:MAG: AAA family ATPase [Desulfamplus sp.]|nr:AAA family ATPase [Desulfamplus sp.]
MKKLFIEKNSIGKDPLIDETYQTVSTADYPVVFSRESVLDLRKKAGNKSVTPLIVQQILQKTKKYSQPADKGGGYEKDKIYETGKLYKIASEILVNGEGSIVFSGQSCTFSKKVFEHTSTLSGQNNNILNQSHNILNHNHNILNQSHNILNQNHNILNQNHNILGQSNIISDQSQSPSLPLSLVQYNDPMEEMDQLIAQVMADGKIPVLWSKARGLMLKHLSKQYPLFADASTAKTTEPKEIIKFIINSPQGRIAYILEDFHHYIGEKDVVNPAVGEIRSLIKDLNRTLGSRGERVYLFVPASYEMPPELSLFFAQSPRRPKKVDGYLDRYGQLMTDIGYLKNTKPLIGATATIDRLIQVLTQMETNNPLLVGYPGVGKTAVVEGLAMAVASGAASSKLKGKMLYSLSLNSLVAGTRYRGDLEVRLQGLMDEVIRKKDKLIIFIDEIHNLLDAGSTEGSMSAGEFLKPLLARGEFPCIGATTFEGAEAFSKDPAFARRFKKIVVNEPQMKEAIEILRGVAPSFERHHGVSIDDGALVTAVRLSGDYLHGEHLPGKAISLVDGTAAYCNMRERSRVGKEDIIMEIERLKTV